MGVGYAEAERRQMLENLDGQIASALARRKMRLENCDADSEPLRSAAAKFPHARAAGSVAFHAGRVAAASRR